MVRQRYSVLIADDDSYIRDVLRLVLRGSEFDVVAEAGSGEETLTKCKNLRPDVVLLDINMPGRDGIEVLREAQAQKLACRFIMVSAEATMGKVRQALEHGAVGFVVKPIRPGRVLDEIAKCLGCGTKPA